MTACRCKMQQDAAGMAPADGTGSCRPAGGPRSPGGELLDQAHEGWARWYLGQLTCSCTGTAAGHSRSSATAHSRRLQGSACAHDGSTGWPRSKFRHHTRPSGAAAPFGPHHPTPLTPPSPCAAILPHGAGRLAVAKGHARGGPAAGVLIKESTRGSEKGGGERQAAAHCWEPGAQLRLPPERDAGRRPPPPRQERQGHRVRRRWRARRRQGGEKEQASKEQQKQTGGGGRAGGQAGEARSEAAAAAASSGASPAPM